MGVHPVPDLLCFGYVVVVFSVDLPGAGFTQRRAVYLFELRQSVRQFESTCLIALFACLFSDCFNLSM